MPTDSIRDQIVNKITSGQLSSSPGMPAEQEETLFKMRFKKGRTPVQEIFFKFKKDQREAERICRVFCAEWKYKFIWVEEFLTDILSKPSDFDDSGEPVK